MWEYSKFIIQFGKYNFQRITVFNMAYCLSIRMFDDYMLTF